MTNALSKLIATQFTHFVKGGRRLAAGGFAALLLTSPTHAATTTLTPTADAYVQAGTNASQNYGTAAELKVRTSATAADNFDTYLKFDTASVPNITSAKLRLYATITASNYVASTIHPVADTAWNENTLTWDNKPVQGAALGVIYVDVPGYRWYQFDVTAYVQGEFNAGRKIVSVAYHGRDNTSAYITAQSREAANQPQLLITYNAAPTVSVTSPASGTSYTAPASINLTANATDSDGTISKLEFYNGTTLLSTDTSAPYSYNWSNVPAGAYALTAKAYDNAGGSTTSTVVNLTVSNNQAPSVSLLAPSATDSFTAPATFSIVANAADSDGSVQLVEFYNGTNLIGSKTQNPYTYDWTNVAAGSYTLTAKAYDNANASTTSAPVTITVNAPQVAPGIYYIYADHLNTPRVITDSANKTVWRWDSDPFGTDMPYEDPDGDGVKFGYNLRFPGQYFDKETGLHYNYFRDYDPSTGRYVQSDPIGLNGGSFSTYGYVGADPVSFADPRGLCAEDFCIGEAIAFGNFAYRAYRTYQTAQTAAQVATAVASAVSSASSECKPGDKWMCEGPGQYDKVGTQKEVTQMGWFTAYGNTEAEATYNWKKMVQAAAPRGFNARHIRPKKCQKIK